MVMELKTLFVKYIKLREKLNLKLLTIQIIMFILEAPVKLWKIGYLIIKAIIKHIWKDYMVIIPVMK